MRLVIVLSASAPGLGRGDGRASFIAIEGETAPAARIARITVRKP